MGGWLEGTEGLGAAVAGSHLSWARSHRPPEQQDLGTRPPGAHAPAQLRHSPGFAWGRQAGSQEAPTPTRTGAPVPPQRERPLPELDFLTARTAPTRRHLSSGSTSIRTVSRAARHASACRGVCHQLGKRPRPFLSHSLPTQAFPEPGSGSAGPGSSSLSPAQSTCRIHWVDPRTDRRTDGRVGVWVF